MMMMLLLLDDASEEDLDDRLHLPMCFLAGAMAQPAQLPLERSHQRFLVALGEKVEEEEEAAAVALKWTHRMHVLS